MLLAASTGMAYAQAEGEGDQRQMLKQALDWALTCSALTALESDKAFGPDREQWAARSRGFGLIAAKTYTDLTQKALSLEGLTDALNQYADALTTMLDMDLERYEAGCEGQYEAMDTMCAEHGCQAFGPPPDEPSNGE